MSNMIKFSKRTQYAVKCLIHLHAYRDRGVISAQWISKTQQIPEKFLSSILGVLKKKGWVRSRQGPSGGYFLVEHTKKIRLKEIIEELEVKFLELEEIGNLSKESRVSQKVILDSLAEVDNIISEQTSHITLSELSHRYSRLIDNENQMYSI